jgi:hypothetical protein
MIGKDIAPGKWQVDDRVYHLRDSNMHGTVKVVEENGLSVMVQWDHLIGDGGPDFCWANKLGHLIETQEDLEAALLKGLEGPSVEFNADEIRAEAKRRKSERDATKCEKCGIAPRLPFNQIYCIHCADGR